ncbi:hypothetical protein RCH12_000396 [Cryobacterium sp. MP_3.1]|uniref:hypothetical protein n=1 Tax=Cryobacterium sp. MP_3.1 TaxID=3071711 RepID=UPI002E0CF932|nr:hypothetical protein [Cryobacterium sp. MP_3.1]
MKLKRRTVEIAVSAVLALTVSVSVASCAMSPMEETKAMDLKTAKGIALAMEDEAAALVPVENAGEQTQFETAPLLGCGDGLYSWSGRSSVALVGGADAEAILESIAVMWEQMPGVVVERQDERVDMTGSQGDFYSAGVWESGTMLKIDSFSPCFPLEDGQHPSDEY